MEGARRRPFADPARATETVVARIGGLPAGAWVGLSLAPFLVLIVRIAVDRRQVFLGGDLALLDIDAHRAGHWQQLVGPYDRYGWHHPGPVYIYLISFVTRLLGNSHGAQGQLITASAVNGLAVAGSVLVAARLGGRLASIIASVVFIGVLALMGTVPNIAPPLIFNPWNPYIVVMPLILLAVLTVAVAEGSFSAAAASLLVATFVVQTDVATAPFCVALVVGGIIIGILRHTIVWGEPAHVDSRRPGGRRRCLLDPGIR